MMQPLQAPGTAKIPRGYFFGTTGTIGPSGTIGARVHTIMCMDLGPGGRV